MEEAYDLLDKYYYARPHVKRPHAAHGRPPRPRGAAEAAGGAGVPDPRGAEGAGADRYTRMRVVGRRAAMLERGDILGVELIAAGAATAER